MSRERLQRSVHCPNCGANGVVHYSENDYPFMRKNAPEVDCIEGEFDARAGQDDLIHVTCKSCKIDI